MVRATKQERLLTRRVSSHAFCFKAEKRHVERPVLFAKILFLKWQFLTGKAHDCNILLDISQAVAVTSSAALFKQVPLLLVPFSSYIFIFRDTCGKRKESVFYHQGFQILHWLLKSAVEFKQLVQLNKQLSDKLLVFVLVIMRQFRCIFEKYNAAHGSELCEML